MVALSAGVFEDGSGYERLMGRWSRVAGAEFLKWCSVPPGKAWLDVGCGNAAFTEEVIKSANPSSIVGIDPAPAQIAYAMRCNTVPSATFHVGDAMSLPYADQVFDVVAMALVIAFLPSPAEALAEMKRVARLDGLVATYMWDLTKGGVHLAPIFRALRDLGLPAAQPPSYEISAVDELRALWNGAGLREVESRDIRIKVHFTDFEDFWQSNTLPIGPLGERLRNISAEETRALRQRLLQTLPIAADGSITYEAVANAVKGRA